MSNRRAMATVASIVAWASAFAGVDPGAATAPRLEFTPLPAGTYTLQRIQTIADATLLDAAGRPVRLSSVTTSKLTLLTFFYSYCIDPTGCPFAFHTLSDVRRRLLADPQLAQRVRFVGISLDPSTDTPEVIENYRKTMLGPSAFEWDVLTAHSVRELLPVLDDFGQDVSIELGSDGTAQRTLHHMLKMFLIDSQGSIREIYTLAYLQPAVILNDIKTLDIEERARSAAKLAVRGAAVQGPLAH
jgi:cytochrome oxidase Cu insertion factor (SCO1/SenC/PrrC family)